MGHAKHLLIVDDEPNVRMVFRTALESPDRTISVAEDGEAALRFLGRAPADLVLLDLQMPAVDGMEVLRRLRAAGNDVPVVIITAFGTVPDAVEAMKLGAIDFLAKPVAPDALRKVVDEVIRRHDARREAPAGGDDRAVTAASQFARNLSRAKRALNRRDWDEAEIYLKQAIALDDRSAEAHNLMGVLLECRNQHDASFREYKAALKHDRHYQPAKHNIQRYYERFTFGKSDVPIDIGEA